MDSTVETIAAAQTPRGEIALRERTGTDGSVVHELVVAGVFAMDTVDTSTEAALAQRPLERVGTAERVLVGGLGLGFTAWQVLKDRRVREVHVVEIEEDLVHWARLGLTPTLGLLARHPRVTLHARDVATVLGDADAPAGPWDLVLLDVDNGPSFLVHEANEPIYSTTSLSAALTSVARGGRTGHLGGPARARAARHPPVPGPDGGDPPAGRAPGPLPRVRALPGHPLTRRECCQHAIQPLGDA